MPRILIFTQPGCLSCELMRIYLEAREIPFEERDIIADTEARRTMSEEYDSVETPTIVVFLDQNSNESDSLVEVITGFDPVRLDQLLDPAPSSDSVTKA
jgi:glutaredoxin